jgi:hypothetical protein
MRGHQPLTMFDRPQLRRFLHPVQWGSSWVGSASNAEELLGGSSAWRPIEQGGRYLSLVRSVNAYVWVRPKGKSYKDAWRLYLHSPIMVDPDQVYEFTPGAANEELLDTKRWVESDAGPAALQDAILLGSNGQLGQGDEATQSGAFQTFVRGADVEVVRSDSPIVAGVASLALRFLWTETGAFDFLNIILDGFDAVSFRVLNRTGSVSVPLLFRSYMEGQPTSGAANIAELSGDQVSLTLLAGGADLVTYGMRDLGAGGVHVAHIPFGVILRKDATAAGNAAPVIEFVGRVAS